MTVMPEGCYEQSQLTKILPHAADNCSVVLVGSGCSISGGNNCHIDDGGGASAFDSADCCAIVVAAGSSIAAAVFAVVARKHYTQIAQANTNAKPSKPVQKQIQKANIDINTNTNTSITTNANRNAKKQKHILLTMVTTIQKTAALMTSTNNCEHQH